MPFLTVRDYKPTIRKGKIRNKDTEDVDRILFAGMPVGLLLTITYPRDYYGSTDDILVSGRVIEKPVNIRTGNDSLLSGRITQKMPNIRVTTY